MSAAGTKQGLACGYAYRGETIHVDHEGAVIWPTWLKEARVDLVSKGEAEAFVDAHWALKTICGWCMEPGTGSLITVNGCLVLSDHEACRQAQLVGDVLFQSYIENSMVLAQDDTDG